jgi:hypothetical protein
MTVFFLLVAYFGSFVAAVQILPRLAAMSAGAALEPLREKETARLAALQLTLRAVQRGIIPAPRVY